MTLGVRAVVLDGEGRVFLVKHGYVSGWHLPGGGVEVGETFRDALRRELAEEGQIELVGEPRLHGIFFNRHVSRRDHVAVYVVRDFRQDSLPAPNREIAACGFFGADALPADTTEGTRLRISEVLQGRASRGASLALRIEPAARSRRKRWKMSRARAGAEARSWYGGLSRQD